jgi:flagellar export protein FliJ
MSIFKFRLQGLLRLRESQRDEARLLLADLLRQDAQLIDDQAALDGAVATARTELGTSTCPGPVDLVRYRDLQSFETDLRQRRRSIDTARRALEPQIAERRQALASAQRELRLLEQLAEREAAEHRTGSRRAIRRPTPAGG